MPFSAILYALLGLTLGIAAHELLPERGMGHKLLAALIGTDGALIGVYIASRVALAAAAGTTLFMALTAAFVFVSAYRLSICRAYALDPARRT